MPESKLREIADAADMIVSGFAFNKNGEMIRIVNLNVTVQNPLYKHSFTK